MNNRIIFFAAILLLSLSANLSVKAQRQQSSKFRNVSYNYFRHADKLTLIAGTGLSVMNSDNAVGLYRSDIGYVRGNGYGPNVSMGAMYQLSPNFGVLGNVEYVGLRGYQDAIGETSRHSVSFRSESVAASGSVVFSFASRYALSTLYKPRFRRGVVVPYVKAGIGFMHYSASSFAESQRGALAPETDYPAIATVIPLGAGLRIRYSRLISIAPEVTMNMTSTDYLDNTYGVGGRTGKNDKFVSASVKVLYTLSTRKTFQF